MSVSLYAYLPVPGEEPEVTARRRVSKETGEVNPGPFNAAAEARKEALARALLTQNPALERFEVDIAEIARFEGVPLEEARRQNRQIELNEPADGFGTQIILYDDWADVSLYSGDRSAGEKDLWIHVWRYLRVFAEAGFFIYDPQGDEVVDLDDDDPEGARATGGPARSAESRPGTSASSQRPWWKFW